MFKFSADKQALQLICMPGIHARCMWSTLLSWLSWGSHDLKMDDAPHSKSFSRWQDVMAKTVAASLVQSHLDYVNSVARVTDEDVQLQNFGVHTTWRRQRTWILGIKSSVRQRSARSSTLRRRKDCRLCEHVNGSFILRSLLLAVLSW